MAGKKTHLGPEEGKRWLHQGRFRDLLDATVADPGFQSSSAWTVPLVGALAANGQFQQAQLIMESHQASLRAGELLEARFHLGINCVRRNRHHRWRRLLRLNLQLMRRHKTALPEAGLAWQGAAFLRFVSGDWRSSLGLAKQALAYSQQHQHPYTTLLAYDLMGHAMIKLGECTQGLISLESAQRLAQKMSHHGLQAAITVSLACYRLQLGFTSDEKELQHLISQPGFQDSYSHARLLLELCRFQIRQGRFNQAKTTLQLASQAVYSSGARSQQCLQQLLTGQLMYVQGQYPLALNLLANFRRSLEPKTESDWLAAALDGELKCLKALKTDPARQLQIIRQIQQLSQRSGSIRQHRHYQRLRSQDLSQDDANNQATRNSEDPLGDFITSINLFSQTDAAATTHTLQQLAAQSCLGLSLKLPLFEPGANHLAILRDGSLLLQDDTGISLTRSLRGSQSLQVIRALCRGPQTMESLFQEVWQLSFQPLRHTQLIYTAVHNLKKHLGDHRHLLENTEGGYQLPEGLRIHDLSAGASDSTHRTQIPKTVTNFNSRQLQLVDLCASQPNRYWTTRAYSDHFGVSVASASRDLCQLHDHGLLLRVGRGRSCSYRSPLNQEGNPLWTNQDGLLPT